MSLKENRKTLLNQINDETVALAVSKALRKEYTEQTAAIKWIERITGIEAETASKWYRGLHAPKSAHLLTLAAHYPEVLRTLCELMGRVDVWQAAMQNNIPPSMHHRLAQKRSAHLVRGDRFVTPKITTHYQTSEGFNLRQVWFLEKLHGEKRLLTKDIIAHWQVKERTARRDIAGLLNAGLVRFKPAGRTGWYEAII